MLAPPRIGFGQPEDVEASAIAGLRHANGLLQRLHAELKHANAEGNGHGIFTPRCDMWDGY